MPRLTPPLDGHRRMNNSEKDTARSRDRVAGLYNKARPSYPDQLVSHLTLDGAERAPAVFAGTGMLRARPLIVFVSQTRGPMAQSSAGAVDQFSSGAGGNAWHSWFF